MYLISTYLLEIRYQSNIWTSLIESHPLQGCKAFKNMGIHSNTQKIHSNTTKRIQTTLTSVQCNSGKPEVCQLYMALIRNEHIVWLQIPADMNS